MSLQNPQPQDVYKKESDGSLWIVVGVCGEPTAILEKVHPNLTPDSPMRMHGGISGYMWNDFQKLEPTK